MSENTENTDVMSWEDALKARAQEQQRQRQAMSTGPKYIGFKGGNIVVDDVPVLEGELDVIVLAFTGENAYYPGRYDPTVKQPPVCWSVYKDTADMVPHENSAQMQHENCVTCPKFQWGSDPSGGRGKACKSRFRIAVVPASAASDPASMQSAELRFATLPVTSTKNFDHFLAAADLQYKMPSFGVLAKLSIKPDAKTQFKVLLEPTGLVPKEVYPALLGRIKEAEESIGYELSREEESAPIVKPLK